MNAIVQLSVEDGKVQGKLKKVMVRLCRLKLKNYRVMSRLVTDTYTAYDVQKYEGGGEWKTLHSFDYCYNARSVAKHLQNGGTMQNFHSNYKG